MLLATIFLANGITSLYFLTKTRDYILTESQLIEEIDVIDRIKSAVVSAETAQRGYLLTGKVDYLQPFMGAEKETHKLIDELNMLSTEHDQLVGNSLDVSELRSLGADVSKKFEEMAQTIILLDSQGRAAAIDLVKTDEGFGLMSDISKSLERLRSNRFIVLDKELSASEQSTRRALQSVLFANLMGFALLCLFIVLQRRAFERSETLNEQLEDSIDNLASMNAKLEDTNSQLEYANDNLEDIVGARTQKLEEQALALTRSNQELESYAYIASHDLQEPLRKIRAFGDRLHDRYGDRLDERGLDYLSRMRSASERMSILISDLLSLSRVKSQELVIKPVALNQVFKMVMSDMNSSLHEAGGKAEIAPLPVVYGDATQLLQIFSNIVSNAIKYRDKTRPLVIKVSSGEPSTPPEALELISNQPYYKILVSDNGIGFDPDHKEKVFAMFQRLHGRREYEGTGIGLAICRKIAERHGGAIVIEHVEAGVGTAFAVYLPAFIPEQYKQGLDQSFETPTKHRD